MGFFKKNRGLILVFVSLISMDIAPWCFGADLTPDEVLRRARESRVEFVKVTSELEGLAPQIKGKEELYAFVNILPELFEVSKKLDFDSLGSSPADSLAISLTRSALKWVRFATDSSSFLQIFIKMADNHTRYLAAHQQSEILKRATTKQEWLMWNDSVSFVLTQVLIEKSEPYVVTAYEDLQADTVQVILNQSGSFSAEELKQVFRRVNGRLALEDVLTFITQKSSLAKDPDSLNNLLSWTASLSENIVKLNDQLPFTLRALPGQLFLEMTGKLLILGKVPENDLLPQFFLCLLPSQWNDLGNLLLQIFSERDIPPTQIPFVQQILKEVQERVKAPSGTVLLEALNQFSSRVWVGAVISTLDAEGIYEVQTATGMGSMILSSMGNGKFLISLSVPSAISDGYLVDYGFFHVGFNPTTSQFEAHHFAQGSPVYPHRNYQTWDLFLKIKPQGNEVRVEGDLNNNNKSMRIEGVQKVSFSKFLKQESRLPERLEGVYRGELMGRSVDLILIQLGGGGVVSELRWGYVSEPFNYGYTNPISGSVVLTSGELDSYKWAQIKGQFFQNGELFQGIYYLSGDLEVKKLDLKRVHF